MELAHCLPISHAVLALAPLRNLPSPTILAWENRAVSLMLPFSEDNSAHGRGYGATQTAVSAAGVLAAAQLEWTSYRRSAGVGGAVSLASGNTPFVLRQHQ